MGRQKHGRTGMKTELALILTSGLTLSMASASLAGDGPLPDGLVYLSDVAPQIAQNMRYAGAFNYTGAPVPGYHAAACIVTADTAKALIAVDDRLQPYGYGLVVFDCYRPQSAVSYLADWSKRTDGPDMSDYFFPGIRRETLVDSGMISRRSSHVLGNTVDVGLRFVGEKVSTPTATPGMRCDLPLPDRWQDTAVDMGTAYDCFTPMAHREADVGDAARTNRAILVSAMEAEGFSGYIAEWWHYRYTRSTADEPYDFPVE